MNSADLQQRSGDCPDLEDLAALLDGMVEEGERQRLLRHLAECQDCYELYAETARFQLEVGFQLDAEEDPAAAAAAAYVGAKEKEEKATVAQFPWRVPLWAGLAAAAALVIAAGIPVYWSFAVPPTFETAEFLPPDVGERSSAWTDRKVRGPGEAVEAERRERAFQLGVQVTNLRAALVAGDREEAAWAAKILHSLANQDPLMRDLVDTYKELQAEIQKGNPLQGLLDSVREAEVQFREALLDDAFYFDFGKWVEAGYLSTQAQEPRFFTEPEVRRFARALPWQDDQQVDVEAQKEVESIREVLGRSSVKTSDYQELRERFERILEIYYPTGRPASP